MLYVFGLSVAFFLFFLILVKKGKTRPDYFLLSWIGVLVLHLALFNFEFSGVVYQYPHLLGVTLALPIVHGPFLYLYTLALTRKENRISPGRVLLFFSPFVLLTVLAIPFYILSADEKVVVYRNQGRGFEWYMLIQDVAFVVIGILFSGLVIFEIRKYRRKALDRFSNLDRKMLRWLEYLAIGLLAIWLLSAIYDDQIIFAAVVVFVLFIGFFGINQYPVFYSIPNIYNHSHEVESEVAGQPVEPRENSGDVEKYAKSKLSEDKAGDLMVTLDTVMKKQEPFRDSNLTLDDLARITGVSANHLSQVINALTGKTFYHYINAYRIECFLRLAALPENRKFTYFGLAYQCGFTSKTTFNKYFKIQTGRTPSEYFDSAEKASAETFAGK
jgi:AraC-like DNA-binding protein